MSILQEYEQIRRDIGEEKYKAVEEYLSLHPELFLSDIYYKEVEWNKFNSWYKSTKHEGRMTMQNIIKEIASYIIKETQNKASDLSNGLNYIVSKTDIQEAFNEQIDRAVYDSVLDVLSERDEVADTTEDTDGIDVVLYSNYAPNYTKDAEDDEDDEDDEDAEN